MKLEQEHNQLLYMFKLYQLLLQTLQQTYNGIMTIVINNKLHLPGMYLHQMEGQILLTTLSYGTVVMEVHLYNVLQELL